jgi:hypothetical protein
MGSVIRVESGGIGPKTGDRCLLSDTTEKKVMCTLYWDDGNFSGGMR